MVPCETLHVENGMEELKTFDEMIWSEGLLTTLPKTNIAPENRPLEKEIPTDWKPPFLGAMLVSGG